MAPGCRLLDYPLVMRPLLCCLTSTSVLLHLVVGCCAHHLHAEESHCHRQSVAACEHGDHEEDEAPTNRHSQECGESECVFASAVKDIQPVFSPAMTFWLPIQAFAWPTDRLLSQRQLSRHDPPPLPLPMHLLLGVLLN
jgi:hypothetical protein